MSGELPEFYFRIRDGGAVVFRVETETRMRRIEMTQIAVVNARNGEVKGHGSHELSPEEDAAIRDWLAERQALLSQREVDDILRTVDRLNLTATWAQQRATPEELDRVSDALLLAMHDLRTVLVRKKADRLKTNEAAE
ncbi:hypothetical protein EF888_03190 [Silicimonas algicola]|uniref:Uncharacterized protein n=1 Tax=Silicimonas algicola TaxID=1826607 RepID=A0A316GCD7_9RHOB|nr:hypothetical protein [Silicimonas algicola]AZQ66222.1 hypothetical protein EF888_03190 [Silicimonas algicola]PWK58534.1 hypothetical protein C8D95_101348 [Silicimonas algicola]